MIPQSGLVLSQEAPYTFRVACEDCSEIFDLFGKLEPYGANGASTIQQRCCEHLDQCRPNRPPVDNVEIYQNKDDASLFKMVVTWEERT